MTERIFEVEISNKTSKGYETATALEMPATWQSFTTPGESPDQGCQRLS